MLGASPEEELGWRAYALPRLQKKWSALGASLILALLWAVWHLPLFWLAGSPYGFATQHVSFALTLALFKAHLSVTTRSLVCCC